MHASERPPGRRDSKNASPLAVFSVLALTALASLLLVVDVGLLRASAPKGDALPGALQEDTPQQNDAGPPSFLEVSALRRQGQSLPAARSEPPAAEGPRSDPPLADGTLYDIFIAIPAAGQERERRDAIRASWTQLLTSRRCKRCRQSKVGYRFVVGTEGDVNASRREAAEHGDLDVLEDFGQQHKYTKRSEKTYRTIRHAVQRYKFKFVLKCDTDSWVFVDKLLEHFDAHKLWDKERLYAGNFRDGFGSMALTDPGSKWYDPVYPTLMGVRQYPKHAKGAGYILSRKLAESIGNKRTDYWEFIPSEDVATGFWLMALEKQIVDIPVEIRPTCHKDTVVDHYITPEIMKSRWQTYETYGQPCVNPL